MIVSPLEKKLEHGLFYKSKHKEIYGYKLKYERYRPLAPVAASFLYSYPLDEEKMSYFKT